MTMIPLDASFGIFVLLPQGWLFMIFVIFCEGFLATKVLIKQKYNRRIYLTMLTSNVVSGLTGIIGSYLINGGWWLVCWFPWVSSHEIDIHNSALLIVLVIYYFAAFVVTIIIEMGINFSCLKNQFGVRQIIKATLLTNAVTYFIGALLITFFVCHSF